MARGPGPGGGIPYQESGTNIGLMNSEPNWGKWPLGNEIEMKVQEKKLKGGGKSGKKLY